MPELGGRLLAERLTNARPDTEVLFMSGYTDDRVGVMSASGGELTLIQKPFYIDELVRKIHEIVAR